MSLSTPTASPAPAHERSDAADAAVELRDVVFTYAERRALDGLSLRVPAGSIFGLLGPNGSGKTTLLSLLIGRRTATAGEVRALGREVTPGLRSRMAIVFQEPSLDGQMTVRETLHLQGRLFGKAGREIEQRTVEMLETVGLADRADARTGTLSGGMKRRVELARALLTDPELILLDEPTLALDPDSRARLWQHLLDANRDGRTLIVATNDVHEAERYCHTVALLDAGRVVAEGTPPELKRDLRRDAVRIEWTADVEAEGEAAMMRAWPGVGHVRVAGRETHVTVDDAAPFLARLFESAGGRVHSVQIEKSTLEDVYFQLVGRGITPLPGHEGER